jgi:hypothetical protein
MLCRSLRGTKGPLQCYLGPLVCFDVATASLGIGCGIIRWPRLHVAGLLAGAGSERRIGEEFFMP